MALHARQGLYFTTHITKQEFQENKISLEYNGGLEDVECNCFCWCARDGCVRSFVRIREAEIRSVSLDHIGFMLWYLTIRPG